MRTTRIALALALIVSPAMLKAQNPCAATSPAAGPTCNVTKNVQTTVANVLYLGLYTSGNHDLNATDSVAYHKTWAANGNLAGTTGTAVAIMDSLPDANAADSVIVLANRPYKLTISASDSLFTFDKDVSGYNTCRDSGTATSCATTGNTLGGKPVTDLYWSKDGGVTFAQMSKAAASIQTSTVGERYSSPITFKSAWFYATDIPGTYTATVVYTVTGQ